MKFLVLGNKQYSKPFEDFGEITYNTAEIFTVDAVVFTGGHDVTPALYGEEKDCQTGNYEPRDIEEASFFGIALRRNIPLLGICRGSQFLTVMSGGKLHQHIGNHSLSGVHEIITPLSNTVDRIHVTSTHHQMMDVSDLRAGRDYELLAWADNLAGLGAEPEVVEYFKTKALAVQFHPEYMPEYSSGYKYYQELIHSHLSRYSKTYQDMMDGRYQLNQNTERK